MPLNRDQILNISDIKIKEIVVPEWGGETVFIRQLTRGQQDEYLKSQFDKTSMQQQNRDQKINAEINLFGHDAFLCACGICDENGAPIFTRADIKKLEEKNGEAIGLIAKEIISFSGMSKDIEDLEKLKN
jgi:hypothetical protein